MVVGAVVDVVVGAVVVVARAHRQHRGLGVIALVDRDVAQLGEAGAQVLAADAVVAGIRVESAKDDLRALARREPGTVSGEEINALYSSGQRYQVLSVGLGVASAVLAGAGATLLVLELTDDSALEVASGGNAGFTYRQRF